MAAVLSDATYVVMIDRTYLYHLTVNYNEGAYRTGVRIVSGAQPVVDDVIIRVLTLPRGSDYNDVARAVRNYRIALGEIKPLSEKCRERAELEYARKYPLIRIRMGWKPVPPDVEHQTTENEPPMHVACTFRRVRELADKMKERGIRGAELCLVGWNQKGHDGRWPQVFPVEEALGGEEELIKTVKHVQSLGYAITCHTNVTDHYEIADTYDPADLAANKDGGNYSGGRWAGGVAYHSCPDTQLRYAKRDLPRVAELGFRGLHYIDCLSIIRPIVCFNENHPSCLSHSIARIHEIMKLSSELMGGFSSEGCADFCMSELDFSLYNTFKSNIGVYSTKGENCLVDEVIPLIELTYHGILLYNPSSFTVNYTIKEKDTAVVQNLLGGRPAMYFYSRFVTEKEKPFTSLGNNWMGEIDLTCDTDEDMMESVEAVFAAASEYSALCDRQLVFFEWYKKLENGLRIMRYEDGVEVAANLTDATLFWQGVEIEPHSYKVFRGEE